MALGKVAGLDTCRLAGRGSEMGTGPFTVALVSRIGLPLRLRLFGRIDDRSAYIHHAVAVLAHHSRQDSVGRAAIVHVATVAAFTCDPYSTIAANPQNNPLHALPRANAGQCEICCRATRFKRVALRAIPRTVP